MNEIDVYKLKLAELSRACGEVKTLTESHVKAVEALKGTKDQLEAAIFNGREEHRKFVASAELYRTEFEARKHAELQELERQKAEARQLMQLAESQKAEAERRILDAQSKEARAAGVMEEANAAKAFWESKKESIRAFLTSGS